MRFVASGHVKINSRNRPVERNAEAREEQYFGLHTRISSRLLRATEHIHHQDAHLLLPEHTVPQPGECEPHGTA